MENTIIMGHRNRIKNFLTAPIASQYFQLDEWTEFENALNEFIWGTNFNQNSFFKKYNLGDQISGGVPGPPARPLIANDFEILPECKNRSGNANNTQSFQYPYHET